MKMQVSTFFVKESEVYYQNLKIIYYFMSLDTILLNKITLISLQILL